MRDISKIITTLAFLLAAGCNDSALPVPALQRVISANGGSCLPADENQLKPPSCEDNQVCVQQSAGGWRCQTEGSDRAPRGESLHE